MDIALICPSNLIFMPYLRSYEDILVHKKIQYDIFYWDRFQIEDSYNTFVYRDEKKEHQRNYLDYYKYKLFLKRKLMNRDYDKIIVFSLQLAYFLKDLILKKYSGRFILDIRDHNKVISFFNAKKFIENSEFTVISSIGYTKWLPKSNKFVVNHNASDLMIKDLEPLNLSVTPDKINVSCIGAIRDRNINIKLIDSLKSSKRINLFFHGEGEASPYIKEYIVSNGIENVVVTNQYKKQEEDEFYTNSDFVNVLRYNDGINNSTALPNRLYKSVVFGKPMLAFSGTYLAEQIETYKLGLVINSFDNIEREIISFSNNFDRTQYHNSRTKFLEIIDAENKVFITRLNSFLELRKIVE